MAGQGGTYSGVRRFFDLTAPHIERKYRTRVEAMTNVAEYRGIFGETFSGRARKRRNMVCHVASLLVIAEWPLEVSFLCNAKRTY